jgi:DNA polymerase-3 subunit delta
MTFDAILSDLKAGRYKPVYFLSGEEPYFIDVISGYIADHSMSESEKSFNLTVLYGRDTDMNTILSSARRFPMMAPIHVVIVREAQMLRKLDGLESYLNAPMASTRLVFAYKYKRLDKRTKLAKALAEKSVFLESEKLWEDKVPAWISAFLEEKGYHVDRKSASLLVDFLGNDLGKIANELDKLLILMPEGSNQITADLIEKNIGISKDYNNFELTRALAGGDTVQANRIIRFFAANPRNNPFVLTISALFFYFVKVLLYHATPDKSRENIIRVLGISTFHVSEYQLAAKNYPLPKTQQIISWLREYDLKSKGGSLSSEGDLLKELVYKILH